MTPLLARLDPLPGIGRLSLKSVPPPVSGSLAIYHGSEGPLGYVISLAPAQEPDKPLLALNTYCRPFFVSVSPNILASGARRGVSIPVSRASILTSSSFPFDLAEIAGWVQAIIGINSTLPLPRLRILRFHLVSTLACTSIEVPGGENRAWLIELIGLPTSYPAKGKR